MKVLSLNLWFSDYLRKEITIIFKNYILEKKPDVIYGYKKLLLLNPR